MLGAETLVELKEAGRVPGRGCPFPQGRPLCRVLGLAPQGWERGEAL